MYPVRYTDTQDPNADANGDANPVVPVAGLQDRYGLHLPEADAGVSSGWKEITPIGVTDAHLASNEKVGVRLPHWGPAGWSGNNRLKDRPEDCRHLVNHRPTSHQGMEPTPRRLVRGGSSPSAMTMPSKLNWQEQGTFNPKAAGSNPVGGTERLLMVQGVMVDEGTGDNRLCPTIKRK